MMRLSALLPSLLLASCYSIDTDAASSVSPEFVGRTYARICVSTPGNDLLARRAVEEKVAEKLEPLGVEVIQLGQVLFPGREYTEAEVREAVRTSGADGFLIVAPLQTWTDSRYVPPSMSTISNYGWSGHPYGWGYSTTWMSGGYTISQPRATFDVRLLDVATEEVAWVASVGAAGWSDTSWIELREAAAVAAVEKLLEDGMLAVTVAGEGR